MGILSWLKRRRRELDLDEEDFQAEVRAHLAIAAEEKVADGVDHQDARYAALREFGNVTQTTEAARRVWTPRWLGGLRDLSSDVRYAIRALARNRGFSLTVIGVLTLGIGLNATVFTMLKGMALTPLAGVDVGGEAEGLLPRDEHRTHHSRLVPRLPVPPRQRQRVLRPDGFRLRRSQCRARAERAPGVG